MVNSHNPSSNPRCLPPKTRYRPARRYGSALVALCCSLLLACTPKSSPPGAGAVASAASGGEQPAIVPLSLKAQAGKQLFFDKSLSASGAMSCASCHDPDHAYGPPNALAVQLGGPALDRAGMRAVPSLRYKLVVPAYSNELVDPDGAGAPGPG